MVCVRQLGPRAVELEHEAQSPAAPRARKRSRRRVAWVEPDRSAANFGRERCWRRVALGACRGEAQLDTRAARSVRRRGCCGLLARAGRGLGGRKSRRAELNLPQQGLQARIVCGLGARCLRIQGVPANLLEHACRCRKKSSIHRRFTRAIHRRFILLGRLAAAGAADLLAAPCGGRHGDERGFYDGPSRPAGPVPEPRPHFEARGHPEAGAQP